MVFGLLAVIGKARVAAMLFGECSGCGGGQRNALVGRTEQHKGLWLGIVQGTRVEAGKARKCLAGIEQPHIEEVRTDPTGFEGKLSEAQYATVDSELKERVFGVLHHSGLQDVLGGAHG